MTVMERRRRRSAPMRVLSTLWLEWDATISVLAGLVTWAFIVASDRPLEPSQPLFAGLVGLGGTVGLGAFVTGRWISDRLAKDEFGAMMAAIDPDESVTQRPYVIMALAGLVCAAVGLTLAVTSSELTRPVAAVTYAAALTCGSYCILGTMSLVVTTRRHQKRAALLRAMKEAAAREKRLREDGLDS